MYIVGLVASTVSARPIYNNKIGNKTNEQMFRFIAIIVSISQSYWLATLQAVSDPDVQTPCLWLSASLHLSVRETARPVLWTTRACLINFFSSGIISRLWLSSCNKWRHAVCRKKTSRLIRLVGGRSRIYWAVDERDCPMTNC